MLAIFDDLYKASETVAQVFMAGIIPTTLELLDNIYIKSIEDYVKIGLPVDAEAVLLIEVDGDPAVLDKQVRVISKICKEQGAQEIKVAQNEKEAEDLWVARRSAFAAVSRVRPTIIGEDCTVPRDKIPEVVQKIREISTKYNLLLLGMLTSAVVFIGITLIGGYWAAGLVLAGLWAADVSTAVGLLLGSSTLVVEDIWKRFIQPDIPEKQQLPFIPCCCISN